MLGHEFQETPGHSTEVGDNFRETAMFLRCKWCTRTPAKAREDGCAIHELETNGVIRLDEFNPDGVAYFKGRNCVTCGQSIMGHWLINHADADLRGRYWCDMNGNGWSDGITDCVWDVKDVAVPHERSE